MIICSAKSGITEVVVPETVASIRGGAFYSCEDLVSIDLSKVEKLEQKSGGNDGGIFERCTNLKALILPESVTGISLWNFYDLRQEKPEFVFIIIAPKGS